MNVRFCRKMGAIVALVLFATPTALQAQDENAASSELFERFMEGQREPDRIDAMFAEGKGVDALPELLQLLQIEHHYPKRKALDWLTRLGPESTPALPTIERLLAMDEPEDHIEIFALLKAMGRPALPLLVKATEHKSRFVRSKAVETIGEAKFTTSEVRTGVRARFGDVEDFVRGDAALAACRLGDHEMVSKVIEFVEKALREGPGEDGYSYKAEHAAQGLIELGHLRGAALGKELFNRKVRSLLDHQDRAALSDLGPQAGYGLAAVFERMDDLDWRVRLECVLIARRLGDSVRGTTPAVLKALEDEHPLVRFHAALAVGNLREAETVPMIEQRLQREQDWAVRYNLLHSLAQIATIESLAVYDEHRTAHGIVDDKEPDWEDYSGKYPDLFSKRPPRIDLLHVSDPLANLAEPALSKQPGYAFRMLLADAGLTHTQIVRVFEHKGKARIVRREFEYHSLDGKPYEYIRGTGYASHNLDRELSAEQWKDFQAAMKTFNLRSRPAREEGIVVLDGTVWIFEEFKDGKYHAIVRYSPEERDPGLVALWNHVSDLTADQPAEEAEEGTPPVDEAP